MTNLWGVSSRGKGFVLSTNAQQWRELPYQDVDVKRVSATEFFVWAISSDHQIYIYVPARDVPIRCRAVSYENERWNPVYGFSAKLLPTDRPHWSSADGLTALPLDDFRLPTSNWQWEGEWYVEDNLEGQPLEPEGWTYAIDFPATYAPNKTWNSLVRRRKWMRYRRYAAVNQWASVSSLHDDPVQEPFIDVAVGGTEVPGGDADQFSVWAVTILGRVVYRYGVTTSAPEGQGWVPVETPDKCEVSQVSCGPTGLVWILTWEGNALVRLNVNRENSMGSKWAIVESPSEDDKLMQVSVGINAVWAVSRNKKVWFRRGIKGLDANRNKASAIGSGWLEMVGEMMMVSVGVNDQVCGLSADCQKIYIRTGVTLSESSGRTWKLIEARVTGVHRRSSLSSTESYSSTSTSIPVFDDLSSKSSSSRKSTLNEKPNFVSNLRDKTSSQTSLISFQNDSLKHNIGRKVSSTSDINDCLLNNKAHLDRGSISSLGGGSYNAEFPSVVWDSSIAGIGELADAILDEFSWLCVSAGGCLIEQDLLPPWFSENMSAGSVGPGEPWYDELLMKFKERQAREILKFSSIPKAIEKSTWVKTGICEWYKSGQWLKTLLELEQQGIDRGADRGCLTCHHKKHQLSLNLNEITGVIRVLERTRSHLAIYTAKRILTGKPFKFVFPSEEDLENWWATLNNSCRSINCLPSKPEKVSIWSTTCSGDVYVHHSSAATEVESPSKMFWTLLGGGHLRIVETCRAGVTWGLGYNCCAWVYTYGYGGGPYRSISGCNVSINNMSDVRCFYIYENQRWNPLTGFSAKGLPTDRYMWSDQTGRLECTKDNAQLPSSHWQWISEWCIDYKTPGGVDNQGWQYAVDFPRSYHSYKSFTDYVRRRRWIRRCRLLTSGPWKQLGSTLLLDVSFQVDAPENKSDPISTWAVATNGDVLRRIGVTAQCPTGESWVHVPTEKAFCSISVGADNAVWGIAKDGSAHLRHGISAQSPNGLFWCHVEPPQVGCPLRQISAGKLVVLAVDESNRLWCRQEIVEIFKEGTHWKQISTNVKQASVSPMDQIWAIIDNYETPAGVLYGVVCQRSGMSEENTSGSEWKQGIGGNWNHICARACSLETT